MKKYIILLFLVFLIFNIYAETPTETITETATFTSTPTITPTYTATCLVKPKVYITEPFAPAIYSKEFLTYNNITGVAIPYCNNSVIGSLNWYVQRVSDNKYWSFQNFSWASSISYSNKVTKLVSNIFWFNLSDADSLLNELTPNFWYKIYVKSIDSRGNTSLPSFIKIKIATYTPTFTATITMTKTPTKLPTLTPKPTRTATGTSTSTSTITFTPTATETPTSIPTMVISLDAVNKTEGYFILKWNDFKVDYYKMKYGEFMYRFNYNKTYKEGSYRKYKSKNLNKDNSLPCFVIPYVTPAISGQSSNTITITIP